MASIHTLPGKPNWYCSLKLANGRWTFKSTGLKAIERNRATAQSLCEQWQRVEDNLDPKVGWENCLAFENSREVAEQFVTATRKLSQGGFTEADARALLDELLKAGRQNPLSQESVEQFFNAWLEGKELARKKRTADPVSQGGERFSRYAGQALKPAIVCAYSTRHRGFSICPPQAGLLSCDRLAGPEDCP